MSSLRLFFHRPSSLSFFQHTVTNSALHCSPMRFCLHRFNASVRYQVTCESDDNVTDCGCRALIAQLVLQLGDQTRPIRVSDQIAL